LMAEATVSPDIEASKEAFREHHKVWKEDRLGEQVETLPELLGLYRKWLFLEETEDIEIMLASLLDREIAGDPIWTQVIAPSGDKKTEICRSFRDYPKAYCLDNLTERTLVSGLTQRNKDTGEIEAVAGLLPKIDDHTLIIKDFTTMLGKSKEFRTELYGQLRSIYDGFYEVGFGSLPEPLRIQCRIGLIVACTGAIDRYAQLENHLGTRFLKVRSDTDPVKATQKALENAEHSERMRLQLRGAVAHFIESLKDRGAFEKPPSLTEDQKHEIIKLGLYVAKMRASVWARYDRYGDLLTLEAIDEEKPTRVSKQLMKLSQLLAIIRGHDTIEESELSTLRRVARDTSMPTRQGIIDAFHHHGDLDGRLAITDIDAITKEMGRRIHYKTAKNQMEIMETLYILDRDDSGTYRISDDFRPLARYIHTLHPHVTSEKEPKKGLFSEVSRVQGVPLSAKMEDFTKILRDVERSIDGQPVDFSLFIKELTGNNGWTGTDVKRISELLKRDRVIFEPRPGYIMLNHHGGT